MWYDMVYSGRKLLASLSHNIEIKSTFDLGEDCTSVHARQVNVVPLAKISECKQ